METIKEEKKADLEQLLNSLVSKGWKPFRESRINEINRAEQYAGNWNWCCWGIKDAIQRRKSTRELVSKEGGLWQFVCENGMVKIGRVFTSWTKNASCDDYGNLFWDKACPKDFYEYRLIETSLKNEDELEQFLLDNIIINEQA